MLDGEDEGSSEGCEEEGPSGQEEPLGALVTVLSEEVMRAELLPWKTPLPKGTRGRRKSRKQARLLFAENPRTMEELRQMRNSLGKENALLRRQYFDAYDAWRRLSLRNIALREDIHRLTTGQPRLGVLDEDGELCSAPNWMPPLGFCPVPYISDGASETPG